MLATNWCYRIGILKGGYIPFCDIVKLIQDATQYIRQLEDKLLLILWQPRVCE